MANKMPTKVKSMVTIIVYSSFIVMFFVLCLFVLGGEQER